MKKNLTLALAGLCVTALLATPAAALRNLSLRQMGELPRDQFVDLVDPELYRTDKMIVQFSEDTRVRLQGERLVSLEGRSLSGVEAFLKAHPEIEVSRVFQSMTVEELDAYVERGERLSGIDVADLNNFYLFTVKGGNRDAQGLLLDLLKDPIVQTAYYEAIPSPAVCGSDPTPATPNYVANQDYREAAPTGVDIDYAWNFDPTYGNGLSTYWFQDLEWGWTETHEDFGSLTIYSGPDSTDPDFFNHGTAVMSIVGACDDSKGVTGLTPEVRLTARVVSGHSSTADALIAIGSQLITGETYLIEMHAPGPNPGWTCVCNCGQFTYIAMEYWTAEFNAILANSTNGRTCIEAAGNGSMDLDWAGYGNAFNLGFRDSGAIVVGAGTSGSVHNPQCWTNHGTRISAQGWGDGIHAAGYGDLFNPAGVEQDYTSSFSGTSGASPIVAGTAISLALIHRYQHGTYMSPWDLRSRLTINGTPQGPVDTWKEISVLPNMKGILAPDLQPYTFGDWVANIVPSDVTDTHTLPAALPPAPATTYVDWAWINASRYGTATPARAYLYRDDVQLAYGVNGSLSPWTTSHISDYTITARGGLHYLRNTLDATSLVDESVETNNTTVIGYRWEPTILVSNTPQTFTRGPLKNPQGYSSNALDGYGNGGGPGWWDVTGVMPATGADYDIRLYSTDPTPTTGWDVPVASSAGVSSTDFVGHNRNGGTQANFTGVINYTDSVEDYTVEREASTYVGAPPSVQALLSGNALNAGEILDVFEMNITSLTPVRFILDITDGNADVALLIYGPSSTSFARSAAAWTLNAAGNGGDEAGTFTPTATGFHGIVVVKSLASQLAQHATYNLYWGPPTGDLTTILPSGWTAPVVARNSGGSVGVLPAILNEGASLGDAGVGNVGSGTTPGGENLSFTLDGATVYTSGNFMALSPGYVGEISARSIGTVKGGRHELGAIQDVNNESAEELPGGEANNRFYTQYAWAPHVLAAGTPESRTAAPNYVNPQNPDYWSLPAYNQDGYRLSTSYWSAVAAMPTHAEGYPVTLMFDNSDTNPLTAYLYPVASHYPNFGMISFVTANGNVLGNGFLRNVGVSNGWPYPSHSTEPYTVQAATNSGDMSVGYVYAGLLAAGAGGGQLLHIRDIYLVAGQSYPVNLFNNSGVDLGVALFQAGLSYSSLGAAAAVFNTQGAGGNESGVFTATTTGWHGVAIYRTSYLDLGPDAAYRITVGNWGPAAITDLAITPVDFSEGHATVHITFTPVTTDVNGYPLTVDHYTVIAVETDAYDFSAPYVEPLGDLYNDGEGPLYFANIGWTTSAYLHLVAVDEDGMVLASSSPLPWSCEADIPGFSREPRLSVPATPSAITR